MIFYNISVPEDGLDFNLGLDYNHFEYDSFSLINGVRVCKDRDSAYTKQVSISLFTDAPLYWMLSCTWR